MSRKYIFPFFEMSPCLRIFPIITDLAVRGKNRFKDLFRASHFELSSKIQVCIILTFRGIIFTNSVLYICCHLTNKLKLPNKIARVLFIPKMTLHCLLTHICPICRISNSSLRIRHIPYKDMPYT